MLNGLIVRIKRKVKNMNRTEYINANNLTDGKYDPIKGEKTHREYYSQFVTPEIKQLVLSFLQSELKRPKYKHLTKAQIIANSFNDIKLNLWDNLTQFIRTKEALEAKGDYPTLAGKVCILKEAARQITEENKKV